MKHVLILGLGNPLLKDDGIGPRVIKELQREELPEGVTALEAGGSFYNYWDSLLKSQHIVVVDSMLGGGPPGTVYMAEPEEINQLGKNNTIGLRHEIHFLDVLILASHYGVRPTVTIIGVEPAEVAFALDLSPLIQAVIPRVVRLVQTYCQSLTEQLEANWAG